MSRLHEAIGVVFLCIRPDVDPTSGELTVVQDFTSGVIVPWKKKAA